jgi:hypothetical protein
MRSQPPPNLRQEQRRIVQAGQVAHQPPALGPIGGCAVLGRDAVQVVALLRVGAAQGVKILVRSGNCAVLGRSILLWWGRAFSFGSLHALPLLCQRQQLLL